MLVATGNKIFFDGLGLFEAECPHQTFEYSIVSQGWECVHSVLAMMLRERPLCQTRIPILTQNLIPYPLPQ